MLKYPHYTYIILYICIFFDGATTRLPRRVGNGLHGKMRRRPSVFSVFGFHFADHSEGATAQWLHEVIDLCRCQAACFWGSHGISAIENGLFRKPLKNDSRGGCPGKKPAIPNLVPILAVEHVDIDKHVYRSCHANDD